MLKTVFALVDGLRLEKLCSGRDYQLRDSVGCRLVNSGKAEFIEE